MLKQKSTIRTKKFIARVLSSALFVVSTAAFASEYETCSFILQLQNDPQAYQEYSARVEAARKASQSQYGESYTDQSVTITRDGETVVVDSFSYDCLSCHDGTTAASHNITYKSIASAASSLGGTLSSHPIGMHYGSTAYVNTQLRGLSSLNPDMLFVDGKVGCLSCHNPFNFNRWHLVADNSSSNLCLTCHIK